MKAEILKVHFRACFRKGKTDISAQFLKKFPVVRNNLSVNIKETFMALGILGSGFTSNMAVYGIRSYSDFLLISDVFSDPV